MTKKISKTGGNTEPKIVIDLTRVAISTQEKIFETYAEDLRRLVVIGNFIEANESLQIELENLDIPKSNHSGKKKRSAGSFEEKFNRAIHIKNMLEEAVQGKKEKETLRAEMTELCGETTKRENLRHQDFQPTTSPLAVCQDQKLNRRRKGKKKQGKTGGNRPE